MINKFNLAKALRDRLDVVATANSYDISGNGYVPNVNTAYIKESVIYGDDESVGLSDDSSNAQFGIYQLDINSPKAQHKWAALTISASLEEAFKKGEELFFGGQKVRMITPGLRRLADSETHLVHVLSIRFSVIN